MSTHTGAWIEQLIGTFRLEPRTDQYTDRPHADLWSGSGVSPSISITDEGLARVDRWLERVIGVYSAVEQVEEWADYPYRMVWRIPALRAHVTYCEGDVSLLVARSDDDFAAIERSAQRFYAEH